MVVESLEPLKLFSFEREEEDVGPVFTCCMDAKWIELLSQFLVQCFHRCD